MRQSFVSLMYHNLCRSPGSTDGDAALSPSITSYFVSEQDFTVHLDILAEQTEVISPQDVLRFFSERSETSKVSGSLREPSRSTSSQSSAPTGLRQAAEPQASPAPPPKPRVHLTFDDGWRECVDRGAPLLAARGFQASLFVTTDLIGRDRFVTAADLRSVSGREFNIGSHCRTHCFLNELSDQQIYDELTASRFALEDLLGTPVEMLSIPNGAVDARVRRVAAEVGYRCLFDSTPRVNTLRSGPWHIGRIAIRAATTPQELATYAAGRFARERCRQQLLSLPKRLLGPGNYRAVRRRLLGEQPHQHEMSELN